MKTYTGTKIVKAQPMTRSEYINYRGWGDVPANESGTDAGYLVEYTDGGTPNDSRHLGYISWSPAAQFEGAYIDIGDVSRLLPYQQRVVAEKAALDVSIERLQAFIADRFFATLYGADRFFATLYGDEQLRLKAQLSIMFEFSRILSARISAFLPSP
jgi:hypothetical protein